MSRLPSPAPADPLPLVREWLDEAAAGTRRNPTAMALATADPAARPAVRMVLLKHLSVEDGYVVFYTNYGSRKSAELEANARAAGVLYWEALGRQLRLEGPVVRSPVEESDAYFATRPRGSQINAWASEQSRPLDDPAALEQRAAEVAATAGALSRPPFWGGYRLWLDALELWAEGADRFHERLRYTRTLTPLDPSRFAAGPWRHQRLQP
ncbi:MAG TPA: pyridoxamine 5'-phosphate oxidase [Gammaproteobacteria bacterium]